jgi:site-specific DNA-methyltransferase (adenine-specific)
MSARPNIRLSWESRDVIPTPNPGTIVPAIGSPGMHLIQGNNADVLTTLANTHAGRAALVYMDPPFFTGRQHLLVERHRGEDGRPERTLRCAFDDRWENLEQYLDALWPRLQAAKELLRDDGSLVLHVDPKTSHYAKILLDELFGMDCFASEIVWRYRRWPAKTPNFQRVHDVLLRYTRTATKKPLFNQLFEPLAASTRATWGAGKQRAIFDDSGRRARSSTTEEGSPGAPLGDVWDISIVAPVAKERTGYPTQKPEALLERLLLALTNPGDLVVDPYVGSGTTLAVAARLDRHGLGIDQNPEAIQVTFDRLRAQGSDAAMCRLMAEHRGLRKAKGAPAAAPKQKVA